MGTIKTVKNDPITRKVPVILLMNKVEETLGEKGLRMGAYGCLPRKPFEVFKLLAKIKSLLVAR